MFTVVKSQVSSQIKVRDLSKAMVAIQPAESSNWSAARADLIVGNLHTFTHFYPTS